LLLFSLSSSLALCSKIGKLEFIHIIAVNNEKIESTSTFYLRERRERVLCRGRGSGGAAEGKKRHTKGFLGGQRTNSLSHFFRSLLFFRRLSAAVHLPSLRLHRSIFRRACHPTCARPKNQNRRRLTHRELPIESPLCTPRRPNQKKKFRHRTTTPGCPREIAPTIFANPNSVPGAN
jgi:hypothetical protein